MNWIDVKLDALVQRKKGCNKQTVYKIIQVNKSGRTFDIESQTGRVTRYCLPEKYDLAISEQG